MSSLKATIFLVACMCLLGWNRSYSQTASRVYFSSITPSVSTGQNYTNWLNDDTTHLVPDCWVSANMQYIDVKIKLQAKTNVSRLALYDYTGIFTSTPAYIYAVNGASKTLIATFTGPNYMTYDYFTVSPSVLADTIVIHKYGNCIPEKIKVYGTPATTPPLSTPITGYMQVCPGGSTSLGNATWGGTWTSGNTSVATINPSTAVVTGVSAGTATISYTISGMLATATMTVNAAPNPGSISGSSGVCNGTTTTLVASGGATGGTWSCTAPAIASVSAGVVRGLTAGSATISYSVSNGCGTRAATKAMAVSASPTAGTIAGILTINTGTSTTLTDAAGGGTWSSSVPGIASISTTGVVSGISAGTSTISYTVTNSCGTARALRAIKINPATTTTTTATVSAITGTPSVCAGRTTTLADITTGGVWSSSSSSVATVSATGIVTGVSAGTTTISYTVGLLRAMQVVTVNSLPSAGSITGTASVTTGATTTLADATTGGTWSSASPSVATVSSAGAVGGVAAGNATISYTMTNGCGTAAATKAVTVTAASTTTTTTTTGGGSTGGALTYCKIPIDAQRWYQLDNTSNGLGGLFDGNLTASVNTGWGKILANYDAYYPLLPGERMIIDSVRFYDGSGSNQANPLNLYYIDSNWNQVYMGSFIGTQYNTWVGPDTSHQSNFALSVPTSGVRYLLISCSGSYPNEMELYGRYAAPAAASAMPAKTIAFKQETGVDAFEWDFENSSSPLVVDPARIAAMKSFGCVRHYLDWNHLEPTRGGYTFNPSHDGGWNYDTIYARCKAEGIEVLADIKTQPGWMQATWPSGADAENVPILYDSSYSNPRSYILQAKVAFQFAARYGHNTSVNPSLLSVDASTRWSGDPANTVKIGLGTVNYIECDNERDKWWKGRNAYQTGREYAANLSAFYDGNKNTLGEGVGVKNADPSMKVVMGGVAMPTTDFLRGMIDWCKQYRGYNSDGSVNLCWDVINYHIYPDNGGSLQGTGSSGAAPEVAHMDTFASNFINAAHLYAKDMPVWVTETGYDLNQSSPLKAPPIGSKTAAQTQADWILRNSLLYARMGVERTFFYMVDDVDTTSATKFSSSGLIYSASHTRKPAADYLMQANKLIGNWTYAGTISTSPIVDHYVSGTNNAYVLVSPTQTGATTSYTLTLPSAGTVKVYHPTVGQDTMSVSTVTASSTSLSVTVTETPTFVIPNPTGSARLDNADVEPSATAPAALKESAVTVYPNPTTGYVHFSVDNESEKDVNIVIYTETGRVCKTATFAKSAGKMTEGVDLGYLPNGLYLMEVGQGNEKVIKKIIKVNR